ncbi:MAG: hypothetical protein AB7G34_08180 [Hyphomicrobiales bacterium]
MSKDVNAEMTTRSVEHYRARNEDAPFELLRGSNAWRPVVRLIDAWAKEELGSTSGYSSRELDCFSDALGIRFPAVVREWWRLAGHHPFVETGLLPDNARFLKPSDKSLLSCPDLFIIVVDDVQTWSCNGIHTDFLSDANPEVHGLNGMIGPADDTSLKWYKEKFIATGLRVPDLIFATLLYHLCMRSPLVRDEAVYLQLERQGLWGGEPDDRLVLGLGLSRYPNPTIVGDLYSDGEDIIYCWLTGCACRTEAAAERVRRVAPAQVLGS